MSEQIMAGRAVRALAIVAIAVLSVPLADACVRLSGCTREDVAIAGEGISASEVIGEDDPMRALARLEELAGEGDAAVPAFFLEEIGLPDGCEDVRVSAAGQIVGYSADGKAADVMRETETRMESKGWTGAPIGGVDGMTFVKTEGACKWTLVTCTQVGSTTSVVFRCDAA